MAVNLAGLLCVQTPLRHGTHCWVLHPGFANQVVGEARAGINNKSRSHHPNMVSMLNDGEQWILFKKIHRRNTPLMFPDDAQAGSRTTCDAMLWASGKTERWVRWSSQYLREKVDDDSDSEK